MKHFHGIRIPNKVYNTSSSKYNDWDYPQDQIIESINYTYFLRPFTELDYNGIFNEIDVVKDEMISLEKLKKANLNESIDLNIIKSTHDNFFSRLSDLFKESSKGI